MLQPFLHPSLEPITAEEDVIDYKDFFFPVSGQCDFLTNIQKNLIIAIGLA